MPTVVDIASIFYDIKDLKDIEIKINSDFNTLYNYKTVDEIINKHSVKYNETEFYKPISMSLGKYIKEDKLRNLIQDYHYKNLKLDKPLEIRDLRQMCLECARLQNSIKWNDIYTSDEKYDELLGWYKETSPCCKRDRNLYVELLIKEFNRNIKINEDDTKIDFHLKTNVVHKMNERILPYIDDLIMFYYITIKV